ncbi:hypothetical protein V7T09_06590 [Segatella copri]|jgi:hypothetical protein|uniref:hypothetical protein n=1 Tax=Segatella copri TaxID=165179 RepID=UPI001C46A1D0|nr:hypothetical protein [Segatella copri]MBW0021350.1 hypothetical protein [Segatella copri]MBW0036922.1 hypothetical protein [Segatella copri]MEE1460194.1 hypothetical protein [Segatella copri]
MNVYYAGNVVHNDHHKELTIGGNVTFEALQQIVADFFKDEDAEPVDDTEKCSASADSDSSDVSSSASAGRTPDALFLDKNGKKDLKLTARLAGIFVNYLKVHHLSGEQLSTSTGLLNKSVVAFYQLWQKEGYIRPGVPNGSSVARFLNEDCHLQLGVTRKSYADYIRKKISQGNIDYDVEAKVDDYMMSLPESDSYAE